MKTLNVMHIPSYTEARSTYQFMFRYILVDIFKFIQIHILVRTLIFLQLL